MRICFLWDWENDLHQLSTWGDGLNAAMIELAKRHEVFFFSCAPYFAVLKLGEINMHLLPAAEMCEAIKNNAPDVILVWADRTREVTPTLFGIAPMANCFSGGDVSRENAKYFEHTFVENTVYLEKMQARGESVSIAFGTNEKLFTPMSLAKHFDVVFPATHCEWKRHNLLVDAFKGTGLKVATAGYMYKNQEQWCYEEPQRAGFFTLPHVSGEALRHLYAMSRVCVIPSRADGGSQRTVLEAMAMNMPVVVCADSDKTTEYVRDAEAKGFYVGEIAEPTAESIREKTMAALSRTGDCRGRDYITATWTAKHYADAMEKELLRITHLNAK